jgi:hypothetical protein
MAPKKGCDVLARLASHDSDAVAIRHVIRSVAKGFTNGVNWAARKVMSAQVHSRATLLQLYQDHVE